MVHSLSGKICFIWVCVMCKHPATTRANKVPYRRCKNCGCHFEPRENNWHFASLGLTDESGAFMYARKRPSAGQNVLVGIRGMNFYAARLLLHLLDLA